MFGPVVTLNTANTDPSTTTAPYACAKNSPIAATAPPSAPIRRVARRPIVVSATWPHSGPVATRASAIAAMTTPICPADSPRSDRNSARNGKNAATANPNRTNSAWTATAGRISTRWKERTAAPR